jgi:acylglycerol lipase
VRKTERLRRVNKTICFNTLAMKHLLSLVLLAFACKLALAAAPIHAHHGVLTLADRTQLALRVWPNVEPKMVVLGIHGFNDYSKAFDALGRELATHRQAVVYAYDQRSFGSNPNRGLWPGGAQLIADVREVTRQLKRDHPRLPLVVIGESMGGALVLLASSEPPGLEADQIVLKAPAIWGAETMPWYQRLSLNWLNAIAPDFTLTGRGLKTLGIKPTDDPQVSKDLSRDPLFIKETRVSSLYGVTQLMGQALHHPHSFPKPTLVLYGLNDKIIPPEPTCYWLTQLERSRDKLPEHLNFIIYPDGWHMLTRQLQARQVIQDIVDWLGPDTLTQSTMPLLGLNKARQVVCAR